MRFRSKHVGALAGLAVGWLIVQYGLVAAVFIGAVGVVGWIAGRVLDGEIDVTQYIRRREDEDLG